MGVHYTRGHATLTESEQPRLLVVEDSSPSSKLILIARVLNVDIERNEILIDAGFGEIYIKPDHDISGINAGDTIFLKTGDLIVYFGEPKYFVEADVVALDYYGCKEPPGEQAVIVKTSDGSLIKLWDNTFQVNRSMLGTKRKLEVECHHIDREIAVLGEKSRG